MTAVGPLDAMFLLGESREQPMHVGGLMLFELPEGAGRDHVFPEGTRDFVSRLYHEVLDAPTVNPVFARRVRNRALDLGYWSWEHDDDIDLEYHVRLSGLARPGRYRELFELTSRLHGTLLDRHRPLWEIHLIEGVQGRRFAVYSKIHHSMIDGVTALKWMQDTLTTDPTRENMPATYALPAGAGGARGGEWAESGGSEPASDAVAGAPWRPGVGGMPTVGELLAAVGRAPGRALGGAANTVGGVARVLGDLAGLTPVGVRGLVRTLGHEHSSVAFQAPRTIFNAPITGARRFAAQSWPIERLEKVRAITGATLNDVLLGMCSGALRNYLLEQNALPDKALTAMVPVSLRGKDDAPGRGNALSTLIADLATDEPDAEQRIRRIMASTAYSKGVLSELSPVQNLMLGALGFAVAGPGAVVPGVAGHTAPPYNLVISNVPGPAQSPLYWNRSRMLGMYPASIVMNGQALNISVTSYDHQLHFGLVGCRRTVPHLQRLLTHLETALTELENTH
ncbi:wax ester/triacylglycerol synthase family O-acyltransferase [Kribbella sandramycini]|uniref:Diacylglycerol O-acyltransferase n=1 Tax=Kribbella sandramycini TaxID=60450 RepID=A0A7Y4L1H5_9ACTN|nr:wax ester/triacylglycerol synthase family O-acyltransferase [Kribbella sandramycini]MBB6564913.1 WS/DGAT/MGAT family acyltransferase [Kribbella sandramycini]NOL42609.1 wax ester/triacylglycerol synthase family O-acyltransferase [Kribbella sandramycini]